jgi:radical SAM protein with 4Fe4S-binding SPASM domain
MRHNLGEIPELLELAEVLDIGAVVTGTLVQCGRATESPGIALPGPEQYRRLLERFETDHEFRRRYERIGTVAAVEWLRSNGPRTECCTFVENPYLTPDGRLYPCVLCHADDFSVTDAFAKPLADSFAEGAPLWSKLLHVSRCRCTDIPECVDCPGRQTCAGGCMGRALGTHGDPMSPDDRCEVRKSVLKQQVPQK